MRTGYLWFAALAMIGSAQAQQQTSQPESLFRTTTRIVEVGVEATWSNGSPVRDLTRDDLRLFDNNREEAILTLDKLHKDPLEGERAMQTEHAVPRPRLSIILLDALNTAWADQIYARRAAAGALEQIQPGDRVAIFALVTGGLRLLHDFSVDYERLKALIAHFSGELPRDGSDPLSPYSAEFSYSDLLASREPASGPWALFRQRQRIFDTLDALTAIAHLVKDAPGQKNLLWLSAGFPLQIEEQGTTGGRTLGTESFHDRAVETVRELNAANLSLYPIDARGLAMSSGAYINIATMQELAKGTGGKAYYNSNDLNSMVREALDDSREGYLLMYSPSEIKNDGRFHSIGLRTGRHGVQLRYRPGYYADTHMLTGK